MFCTESAHFWETAMGRVEILRGILSLVNLNVRFSVQQFQKEGEYRAMLLLFHNNCRDNNDL